MAFTNPNDAIDVLTEALPYKPAANLLEAEKHLRSGSADIWFTSGGTLAKRPGFSALGNDLPDSRLKISWATVSENGTIAATCFFSDLVVYQLYYRKEGGNWTMVGNKQGINFSVSPHEMLWVGSKLYARGDPNTNALGAVVFDENDDTTVAWGAFTPTSMSLGAPTFVASGSWNSSGSDTVEPVLGARYAYTFEWESGQESSRSDYSALSAVVSAKYPQVIFPNPLNANYGASITHINIYRSSDGGGALFHIDRLEIGVDTPDPAVFTTFTYEDTNFAPGGNFTTGLNFSRPAPTGTSNDPPPVTETGVLLTDFPPERPSPIAYFRGRLFFALGKTLFFSVNDEAIPASGLLFHSFRAGGFLDANRATFQDDITDLYATEDALYIGTKRNIFRLVGQLRAEIRINLVYPNVGVFDRRCMTSVASTLFWLDQNRELRSATPGTQLPFILSGPLAQEHIIASRRYSAHTIYFQEHVWIVVAVIDETTAANSKLFVYDAARNFWFAPWNVACDALWDLFTIAKGVDIGRIDKAVGTDLGANFGAAAYFSGFRTPGGNHVNLLRAHAAIGVLQYLEAYWLNTQPTVTVRRDSTSTALTTTKAEPPTSDSPVGYSRGFFWLDAIGRPGDRFFPIVSVASASTLWSLYGLALVFEPNMGD